MTVHSLQYILSPQGKTHRQEIGTFFSSPQFDTLVARTADSLSSSIIIDKLEWKSAAPKNDPAKPLSSDTGYEAMLTMHAKKVEKKQTPAITVSMPPGKPLQVPCCYMPAMLLIIRAHCLSPLDCIQR